MLTLCSDKSPYGCHDAV